MSDRRSPRRRRGMMARPMGPGCGSRGAWGVREKRERHGRCGYEDTGEEGSQVTWCCFYGDETFSIGPSTPKDQEITEEQIDWLLEKYDMADLDLRRKAMLTLEMMQLGVVPASMLDSVRTLERHHFVSGGMKGKDTLRGWLDWYRKQKEDIEIGGFPPRIHDASRPGLRVIEPRALLGDLARWIDVLERMEGRVRETR